MLNKLDKKITIGEDYLQERPDRYEKKISIGIFAFIFYILFIFFELISMIMHSSSDWGGLFIGSFFLGIIIIFLYQYYNFKFKKKYIQILLLFFIIVFLQSIVSSFIFQHINYYRFILTYLSIILIFFLSALFVNITEKVNSISFHKVIISAYIFLTIIGIISIFFIRYHFLIRYRSPKSMLIFSEPSHFALAYSPLLLYVSYISKSFGRFLAIFISILIALIVHSLTLLLSIVIILMVLYRYLFFIILPLFSFLLFIIKFKIINSNYVNGNYFLSRFNILSFKTNNASVLAYLYGWERAIIDFVRSYGIGVGFDQFGFVGAKSMPLLAKMHLPSLNLYDGTADGSKIIAEFGVFGVIILLIYLYYFLKISNNFTKHKIENNYVGIFFISCFLMFFVDLFVRGIGGYFSGVVFIFFSSIYWLFKTKASTFVI